VSACTCEADVVRWESRSTRAGERWLGTCLECGAMTALVPGVDEPNTTDPLTAFLADGPPKAVTPPWLRLFKLSGKVVFPFDWEHQSDTCSGCGAKVVMTVTRQLQHTRRSFDLCLNCGRTSSRDTDGLRMVGETWTPPCPAVKQLRRATFGPSLPIVAPRGGG